MTRITAYAFEADVHCPGCAVARFGRRLHHCADWPNDMHGVRLDAVDSDGSTPHPIFDTDEDQPTYCRTCLGSP